MRKRKRTSQIDKIIQHHVFMAMGAGLIPFAVMDMLAVGKLQLEMLKRLCDLYDKDYDKMQSQAMICSISGSATARVGASFIKTIPVVGTAMGGISMSLMSGASTYALGKMFVRYFEDEKEPFDVKKGKIWFKHYYEKFLALFKEKPKPKDNLDALLDLIELRKNGDINEQTFKTMIGEALEELEDMEVSMDEAIHYVKKLAGLRDTSVVTEEDFQFIKDGVLDSIKT